MNASTFWEKFRFDYRLDYDALRARLIAIEAHRLAADNLVLAPEWREQLDRLNRVRAVYGTTALEGNPLSEPEVSHQIELADRETNGEPPARLSSEQAQIRNASRAQDWVKKRFGPDSSTLGMADILTMHRMITEGSDENQNIPGTFRSQSVQVGAPDLGGVHIGAPHERLGSLMEEFITFLNSRKIRYEHPVIRALLAHFFLVTLHPFGDGNGRISRLLESGILFQGGYNVHGFYGLSNFFYRNGDQYKTLLQESRRTPDNFDITPFVKFGVEGFASELEGINNFVKAKTNRVMYRQMLVSNFNRKVSERRRMLNQREHQLLLWLLDETEPVDPFSENPSRSIGIVELLNSGYVRGAYSNVTTRTFTRELARLSNLGFINFNFDPHNQGESFVEIDFGAIGKYNIS